VVAFAALGDVESALMAEWDSGTKETVKRIPLLTVRQTKFKE
jgi:hypothetical protein